MVPDSGRVARIGVDQFTVMLPASGDVTLVAHALARDRTRLLEAPFTIEERELRIAAKAGLAVFPNDGANAHALFRNAEAALMKANGITPDVMVAGSGSKGIREQDLAGHLVGDDEQEDGFSRGESITGDDIVNRALARLKLASAPKPKPKK